MVLQPLSSWAGVLCFTGGGGRSGPPHPQRRRDTLPDDITELTELKKHEKV
jgi:hypothetical protein